MKGEPMKDEMDILREVSTIAAAHGSRALSEMLKKRVNLSLPNLESAKPAQLQAKLASDKPLFSVQSRILSGLSGSIVLLLEERSAFQLIDMCYKRDQEEEGGGITEVGFSVLKEIGNVVIGSYAGALSIFLKTPVIPSIPTLVNGPMQEIVHSISSPYDPEEYVLLIEALFEEVERRIQGGLFFILTTEAMKQIQESCNKILKTLE
jgi:chemotaxis protein CheC